MRILQWIDRWHLIFILLAAPALLFPSLGRSFAMLIVPGIWIIGLLARRDPLRRTPLNLSLLVLAAMVLVSLYATFDIVQSLSKITGMVLAFGIFFAYARMAERFHGWWGAWLIFSMTSVAVGLFSLVSVQWGSKVSFIAALTSRLPMRIQGLSGAEEGLNPNEISGALVWGIPILMALAVGTIVRRNGLASMFGTLKARLVVFAIVSVTLFTVAILVLTQSRGGNFGLVVALALMLFIAASWRWRVVLVMGGLVIGIVAILFLRSSSSAPAYDVGSALSGEAVIETWEGRVEIWSRAIYGIEDFAFTGMGMNTFRRVLPVLYPLFLVGPDTEIPHAHNELLQAALDLGIPGLIAFVAIYFGAALMLARIWMRARTILSDCYWVHVVVLGMSAGLCAHFVYGLTDAITLGAKPGVLFWMLLGLIAGLYSQMQSGELIKWQEWADGRKSLAALPVGNPEMLV